MEPYDFSVRRPLDQHAAGAIRESLTAVAVRSALVLTALMRRPVNGTCGELAEPAPGAPVPAGTCIAAGPPRYGTCSAASPLRRFSNSIAR